MQNMLAGERVTMGRRCKGACQASYAYAIGGFLPRQEFLLQNLVRGWVGIRFVKGSVVRSHNAILRFSALGGMPRRTSW